VRAAGTVVGHAGELHPRVTAAFDVPARTIAFEVDLDALLGAAGALPVAPPLSTYPPATADLALVVDDATPVSSVAAAIRAGTGPVLESVRLFDVYRGEQVGPGKRSLAFALRLRAPDRTLTADDVAAATKAAVDRAAAEVGASLRS
jgi:phenylalanyl-tRNA synthetase beta chain